MKKLFYMEWAYVLGIVLLAMGTALMEKADFGMSMVVAPAYLLYLKLSARFAFVTFGMMEYMLQALLLVILAVALRKFKLSYLFSFVTAVVYGFTLDGCMALAGLIPGNGMVARVAFYVLGMLLCSGGVAFFFHTYIAPEAYELIVKELSGAWGVGIGRFKTIYDLTSCLISVIMSFAFFGLWHFEGVKLGTVFCALVNGAIIGRMSADMDKRWDFRRGIKKSK